MVTSKFLAADRCLNIKLKGDLVSTNANSCSALLREVIRENADKDWETLELDLKKARMVDSTGLNVLMLCYKQLHGMERKMRILVTHPSVDRTLRYCRLDQVVEVVSRSRKS